MINMKNDKGITLIALVITIVVLMILTVSVGASLIKTNDLKAFYKVKEDIILLSREVESYYLDNEVLPIVDNTNYSAFVTTINSKNSLDRNPNDNDVYYKINISGLKNYVSTHDGYTIKINNPDDTYLVNEKTHTIYYSKGIKLKGSWHFTAFDGLSDGSFAVDYYTQNDVPKIPVVTFESNRSNKSYARIGDTLTLKMIRNNSSITPNAKINGTQVTINWNGNIGTATYTVPNNITLNDNDLIEFKIYMVSEDEAGVITSPTFTTGVFYEKYQIVNPPELTDGMIPIKFVYTNQQQTEGNWVICSSSDPDWYDYRAKRWANVMLSDGTYNTSTAVGTTVADNDLGSMFVWIPRYAYSITKFRQEIDIEENQTNRNNGVTITNVVFMDGATNRDVDRKLYDADYDMDYVLNNNLTQTPMIVHPAFTFGDQELTGFWVAKFEASMAEENLETNANNNVTNKTIKVLPGKESWRYIQIGNMFITSLNMKNNSIYGLTSSDSHMMKNSEWGAVAYLSVSQYGMAPKRNTNATQTDSKWYAYTGGTNYKTNTEQSTTGNITGIYDLNGGAWEYVAGFYNGGNGYLTNNGGTTIFNSNKTLKTEYEKYWDKYEVGDLERAQTAADNDAKKAVADERYNGLKNIKGNAMYEVIKGYYYIGKNSNNQDAWIASDSSLGGTEYYNGDVTYMFNSFVPFLFRGGYWNIGSASGVFCSYAYSGVAFYGGGFRPTLVVTPAE